MTQMDLTVEHFIHTQNNITSSQHLMEPSLKLTTYSINKANVNRYKKKWNTTLYLSGSPWFKVRSQQKHWFKKVHKHMEIKQCSIEPPLGQERNKGIKDFLEFNENEGKCTQTYGTLWKECRGKFIALSAYIKKLGKSHTNNIIAHLKALEQKDADSPRRSRE